MPVGRQLEPGVRAGSGGGTSRGGSSARAQIAKKNSISRGRTVKSNTSAVKKKKVVKIVKTKVVTKAPKAENLSATTKFNPKASPGNDMIEWAKAQRKAELAANRAAKNSGKK